MALNPQVSPAASHLDGGRHGERSQNKEEGGLRLEKILARPRIGESQVASRRR